MSEAPTTFSQDEIGEAGKQIDLGHYTGKLLDVQVAEQIGRDPSLLAIFQITSGPKEGEDLRIYRSLAAYPGKNAGSWFAPGLQEIKADLRAVNGLNPDERLTRDPGQARVQYAKGLARKEVDILVYYESYTDKKTGEKKTVRKKKVTGLAGGNPQVVSSDLNLA